MSDVVGFEAMHKNPYIPDEVAEDGHPSEAALEFRKNAIRLGLTREVSADAIDLAICWAWLGKAISRTKASIKWGLDGVDANTYEFIVALGCDHSLRNIAIEDALQAAALPGRDIEIAKIRKLSGFQNALIQMKQLQRINPSGADLARLSELVALCAKMPGKKVSFRDMKEIANVIQFPKKPSRKTRK